MHIEKMNERHKTDKYTSDTDRPTETQTDTNSEQNEKLRI